MKKKVSPNFWFYFLIFSLIGLGFTFWIILPGFWIYFIIILFLAIMIISSELIKNKRIKKIFEKVAESIFDFFT